MSLCHEFYCCVDVLEEKFKVKLTHEYQVNDCSLMSSDFSGKNFMIVLHID